MVGSRILELLSSRYTIIAPRRDEVNISDKAQIKDTIQAIKPNHIIYAAAVSNPDAAEEQKEYAMHINAIVPGFIANLAAKGRFPLLYFSTDAVFPGYQKDRPYKENDRVDPVNYYGITKQKGEENVLSASGGNCVLRLITVYSHYYPKKKDTVRLAASAFQNGKQFTGIVDQYFNPTYVDDAVLAVDRVIEKKVKGVLHFGAAEFVSNYEFIEHIARVGGFHGIDIKKITVKDFCKGRKAKLGKYVWLDTAKAKNLLGEDAVLPVEKSLKRFWKHFSSET